MECLLLCNLILQFLNANIVLIAILTYCFQPLDLIYNLVSQQVSSSFPFTLYGNSQRRNLKCFMVGEYVANI